MRCTVHPRGKRGRRKVVRARFKKRLSGGASPGRCKYRRSRWDGTPETLAQLFDQAEAITGCQASSGA